MSKHDIKQGLNKMTQGETWKKGLAVVGGNALSSLAMFAVNKVLTNSNQTMKYAAGTTASAVVAVVLFACDCENAALGAVTTTASMGINTATSLILKKSINELVQG